MGAADRTVDRRCGLAMFGQQNGYALPSFACIGKSIVALIYLKR